MPAIKKRTEELVDQRPSRVGDVSRGELMPTKRPPASASWHPRAKRIWRSFAASGQVHWWQQTDWEYAAWLMDNLSRFTRAEESYEKSVDAAAEWDKEAGGLSAEVREEMGFAVERPRVPRPASPQKMDIITREIRALLVTETDRRRAHIELEAPAEGDTGDPVLEVIQGYLEGLAG